jgi:hypothetical protein
MPLFSKVTKPTPQVLRVIHFGSPEWGFTNAGLPQLQALLRSLEEEDIEMFHFGLTARFRGEEKKEAFDRLHSMLIQLQALPEFEGFKIGTAEGAPALPIDEMDVVTVAVKNAKA